MKLSRFILVIWSLILFGLFASAETKQDERGVVVDLSFGIFHSDQKYTNYNQSITHDHYCGLIVAPRIGYKLNNKCTVGVMYKYQSFLEHANTMDYGMFGEYTVAGKSNQGFRVFVDMHGVYSHMKYDYDGGSVPEKNNWEVGFTPGMAFHIPRTRVDLLLRYLFVGFNSNKFYFVRKCAKGCLGGGDWILDAGLHRLQIGASVTF